MSAPQENHEGFIKTPKQLIIVVALAFVVPIALILMIVALVTSGPKINPEEDPAAVARRIAPVGQLAVAGPRVVMTGEQVYQSVCKTCHETGLAGAHKAGDKAAWAKVIAQGQAATVRNALQGVRAMPPRGGNPELSDAEVEGAVAYLVNRAGANWKAPEIKAGAPAVAGARTGEQVVQMACGKCHQTGEGGAPKVGDKAAWRQRLKGGLDATVASAIHGHGGMPARGGFADLTDAEVRGAIVYMFQSADVQVKEAPAAAAAPAPAVTAAAAPAAAPAAATAAPDRGKAVYDQLCMACHMTGAAGAPKTGDKAAWAPRIKTGMAALYASSLEGKGAMPAKGGNPALPDADVKAAVDYLVSQAK